MNHSDCYRKTPYNLSIEVHSGTGMYETGVWLPGLRKFALSVLGASGRLEDAFEASACQGLPFWEEMGICTRRGKAFPFILWHQKQPISLKMNFEFLANH